jgi:hypothetical protein
MGSIMSYRSPEDWKIDIEGTAKTGQFKGQKVYRVIMGDWDDYSSKGYCVELMTPEIYNNVMKRKYKFERRLNRSWLIYDENNNEILNGEW